MRALIQKLNDATKAYDEGHPFLSDTEWDNLYFQFVLLMDTFIGNKRSLPSQLTLR